MRNNWGGIIFFIAGALFLGIGSYVAFFSHKGYVETTARITSVERISRAGSDDDSYRVYVEYTVDGQRYEGLSNSHSSGDVAGKKVKIYYDPEDPSRIVGDGTVLGCIFMGCGALSMIAAVPTARHKPYYGP